MFSIFREHITPGLLDVFDEDFWSVFMPQASQLHPSIWHAMVATATMQNLELIGGNIYEHDDHRRNSLHQYALQHCNKSLRYLRAIDPANATPKDLEMVLLTCILLIVYSSMNGNITETLMHTRNGFYLSNIWHSQSSNQTLDKSGRLANCVTTVSSIRLRFRRLAVLNLLGPFQMSELAIQRCISSFSPSDEPFANTAEAYLEILFVDVSWKVLARSEVLASGDTVLRYITQGSEALQRSFDNWQRKWYAFQRTMKPLDPANVADRVESVRRLALQLLNYTLEAMTKVETTTGQIAWDKFNQNFQRMVDIVSYILDEEAILAPHIGSLLTSSKQFRSLIGLPMVAVGTVCRTPHIRTRGIDLLASLPFTDGAIDSRIFLELAREQQRCEEGGWFHQPIDGGCECIKNQFVCNSHRVCEVIMSSPNSDSPARARLRNAYDIRCDQPGSTYIMTL